VFVFLPVLLSPVRSLREIPAGDPDGDQPAASAAA
jgi:hypothetical protein